jgi:hypothetical protein
MPRAVEIQSGILHDIVNLLAADLKWIGVGAQPTSDRHDRRVQGDNPARAGEILPWSHKIFGNLKTWLRGTFHGVSHKHLSRYLDEFVYRFDQRWREGELFGFVLRRAACGEPLPYHRLVAEPGR